MPNRAADWLKQAKRDWNHAKSDLETGYFEWACFSAQQAAEKAIKAFCQLQNGDAWGHSITGMIKQIVERYPGFEELFAQAKDLDKVYIPSRYPNGFDSGTPEEYFTRADAEKAIEDAREIIEFCESHFPG
jgi:HEPN domain-containing protein